MFNTSSSFERFMIEGELCPNCKKGHMNFEGKRDVYSSESKEPFSPKDEMTGFVCDNCGHTQKAEHRSISDNVPVSDEVNVTVTKADPEQKGEE